MKKQYNGEMSVINTEEKAYLLGILYADGCITDKGNYQKHIRLSLADKELVDRLYELFPFFNYESWDFSKYNKNSVKQFSLRKTCKELYNDLKSHGLQERKSTENRNNIKFPDIPKELWHHFIRGFFDGDGSVYKQKSRPNNIRAEICSSSKTFMTELTKIFVHSGIKFWKLREKQPTGRGKLVMYILEWTKWQDVLELGKFIYKNSTIHLERKKNAFDLFKPTIKIQENPDCPLCGSVGCSLKRAKCQTARGIVRRYLCKNCKKNYTLQPI